MQVAARLPQLTKLVVATSISCNVRVPLGLFSNLSTLSVKSHNTSNSWFLISQIPFVIANSPQLRCLDVDLNCLGLSVSLPTLKGLFAMLSSKNPLCLEQLHISNMDATVDEETLPHLTHLSSFRFGIDEAHLAVTQSVWDSWLVNNITLSDVFINGSITNETISYLSSFSGLKSLAVRSAISTDETHDYLKYRFFTEVLPKHADSLQELGINPWVEHLFLSMSLTSADFWRQILDPTISKSVMKCLKLRVLYVRIDKSTPVVGSFDSCKI
jgi:hypothetical protein